jgi:hypothetical protein
MSHALPASLLREALDDKIAELVVKRIDDPSDENRRRLIAASEARDALASRLSVWVEYD